MGPKKEKKGKKGKEKKGATPTEDIYRSRHDLTCGAALTR